MLKPIVVNGFLFLLFTKILNVDASCDIFFYNKCPLPPRTIQVNVNEFCRQAKTHVDCVNRRLENCTEVQEYGPALETLKLNFQVYLTQATSHGCHNLHDQIRIPRRLPRTRPSTKKPRRFKSKKRRTTFSVEYHCRMKLLVDSCGQWNPPVDNFNRSFCHETFQYVKCLAPLRLKCQNFFSNDQHVGQVRIFLQDCFRKYLKTSKNEILAVKSNDFNVIFSVIVAFFFSIRFSYRRHL